MIHLANEQPLLADLFAMPTAADQTIRCTNLRTLAGKRPVFADDSASIFVFPYTHIRFVEIPPGSEGAPALPPETTTATEESAEEPEADLELDEDFLRRIREV